MGGAAQACATIRPFEKKLEGSRRRSHENRTDFASNSNGDDRDGAAVEPQSPAPVDVSRLSHKRVKKLIAAASTAQDHLVLAIFRWEAGKMKEKEQYHLEMAEIYRLHPLPFDSKLPMPMQQHCKYFAEKAHEAANADEELAAVREYVAQELSHSR